MKRTAIDPRQKQVAPAEPVIETVMRSRPMDPAPVCSVMITTRNQSAFLVDAVRSVLGQGTLADFEVIVVDDASTDGTKEAMTRLLAMSTRPLVYARLQKQVGPGGGRNAAVSLARGQILLFTDSDCLADPSWLDRMVAAFHDTGVGVVQGRVEGTERRVPLFEHHVEVHKLDGRYPTANTGFRRLAVEGLRFNPACWYWEDIDLAWKVLDRGWKGAFANDALVFHRIIPVSPLAWVLWPRHSAVIPAVCAAHPSFRRHLFGRVWIDPMNLWFELAIVGLLLMPWQWLTVALTLPYLVMFARTRGITGRFPPAKVAAYVARDMVGFIALLSASVRRRALVL